LTDDSDSSGSNNTSLDDLIENLGIMARRDTLRRVVDEEFDDSEPDSKTLEVCDFCMWLD
jgi:hypothetical protein